jgi:Putative metallopeptidase
VASRALAAIALTCAVAAGAAGCGGSSGDGKDKEADVAAAFKQGYSAQRVTLNKVSDQIGETLTGADGKSDAQVETELRAVQGSYHAQLAKLGKLTPPDALKADFAKVTKAAAVLDADLVAITKAAAAHDAAGAQAATEQLVGDAPALKAASATLGKKLGLKPSADAGTTTTASDGGAETGGKIHVVYDPPSDADAKSAKEILQLGGTDGIAEGLSHSFVLPQDMGIHVVDGFVGPNYDPQSKTITLSYGFVNYVADQLTKSFPALKKNQEELGREWAAVNGFVLLHEFGHALIDLYGLPVLGKEEDAADSVATVFLTTTVKNGAEYAFDAASFFNAMSARQRKLAPSAYWDEHSLDKQRAYAIVCWIAGSSEDDMATVRRLGILDDARLQRCPSEYQQKVRSWDALLQPHVRG